MFNNLVFYNLIRIIIMLIIIYWGSKIMLLIFDEFNDIFYYCIKQCLLYGFLGGVFLIIISLIIDWIIFVGELVLYGDYSVYRNLVLQ